LAAPAGAGVAGAGLPAGAFDAGVPGAPVASFGAFGLASSTLSVKV